MKALMLVLTLISVSAFANNNNKEVKVITDLSCSQDFETTFRICNPTYDSNRVNADSDEDAVCEKAGYKEGALAKTMIGTESKRIDRKDRHSYYDTVLLNKKGDAKNLDRNKKREAIFQLDCKK